MFWRSQVAQSWSDRTSGYTVTQIYRQLHVTLLHSNSPDPEENRCGKSDFNQTVDRRRIDQGDLPPYPCRTQSMGCAQQSRLPRRARESPGAIRDAERGRAQEGAPGVARLAALPEREVFWCGPDATR